MMKFNRLGCLILILLGIVLFQNCSQPGQGSASDASSLPNNFPNPGGLNQGVGGNGTQYDGKILPGTYVRQLTDQFCGSEIENLGEIIVTETQATGRLIDPSTCAAQDLNINLNTIEQASYQQGRIGFLEGIYSTQVEEVNQQKVEGIDEVWCRKEGSTSATGLDIVVKADYQSGNFQAVVASAKTLADGSVSEVQHAPFEITERRFEDMDRVRYRAPGFELEIRRRDFDQKTGLMRGDLLYAREGMNENISIYCRLGGQLDVMIPKK